MAANITEVIKVLVDVQSKSSNALKGILDVVNDLQKTLNKTQQSKFGDQLAQGSEQAAKNLNELEKATKQVAKILEEAEVAGKNLNTTLSSSPALKKIASFLDSVKNTISITTAELSRFKKELSEINSNSSTDQQKIGYKELRSEINTVIGALEKLKRTAKSEAGNAAKVGDVEALKEIQNQVKKLTDEEIRLQKVLQETDKRLANISAEETAAKAIERLEKALAKLNSRSKKTGGDSLGISKIAVQDASKIAPKIAAAKRQVKELEAAETAAANAAKNGTKAQKAKFEQITSGSKKAKQELQDLIKASEELFTKKAGRIETIAAIKNELKDLKSRFSEIGKELTDLGSKESNAKSLQELNSIQNQRKNLIAETNKTLDRTVQIEQKLVSLNARKKGTGSDVVSGVDGFISEIKAAIVAQKSLQSGNKVLTKDLQQQLNVINKQQNSYNSVLNAVNAIAASFKSIAGNSTTSVQQKLKEIVSQSNALKKNIDSLGKRLNSLREVKLRITDPSTIQVVDDLIAKYEILLKTAKEQDNTGKGLEKRLREQAAALKELTTNQNKFNKTVSNVKSSLLSVIDLLKSAKTSGDPSQLVTSWNGLQRSIQANILKLQFFIREFSRLGVDNQAIQAAKAELERLQRAYASVTAKVTKFKKEAAETASINNAKQKLSSLTKTLLNLGKSTTFLSKNTLKDVFSGEFVKRENLQRAALLIEDLKRRYKQLQTAATTAANKVGEESPQYEKFSRVAQQATSRLVSLSNAATRVNNSLQSIGGIDPKFLSNSKQIPQTLRTITEEGSLLSAGLARLSVRFAKAFGVLPEKAKENVNAFRNLEDEFSSFRSGVVTWSLGLALLGQTLSAPIAEAIKKMSEFTDVIGRVGALTNATKGEFEALVETAKQLGAVTRFTALEASEGLKRLAQAGFSAREAIVALPTLLNLAQAASIDLAKSSEIVTNIMAAFEIKAIDVSRAADVLTKAANTSNATIERLGFGFTFIGSIAKGVGASFEDIIGSMAKLNSAGLRGTLAGTALRGALNSLFNPTKDEARVMALLSERIGGLGLQLKNASGNFVGFASLIRQLESAGFSSEEALRLFGQRAGPGIAALLRVGSDALDSYISDLENASGTTNKIGDVMENTFKGVVTIMQSAADAVAEDFGHGVEGTLRFLAETITVLLNKFLALRDVFSNIIGLDITSFFDNLVLGVVALTAAIGAATFAWFLMIVPASQFLAFSSLLVNVMAGVVSSMVNASGGAVTFAASLKAVQAAQADSAASTLLTSAVFEKWLASFFSFGETLKSLFSGLAQIAKASIAIVVAKFSKFNKTLIASIFLGKNHAGVLAAQTTVVNAFSVSILKAQGVLLGFTLATISAISSTFGYIKALAAGILTNTGFTISLAGATKGQIAFSTAISGVIGRILIYIGETFGATAVTVGFTGSVLSLEGALVSLLTVFTLIGQAIAGFFSVFFGTPFGLAVLGVTALVVGYNLLSDSVAKTNAELEKQKGILKASASDFKAATDRMITSNERLSASVRKVQLDIGNIPKFIARSNRDLQKNTQQITNILSKFGNDSFSVKLDFDKNGSEFLVVKLKETNEEFRILNKLSRNAGKNFKDLENILRENKQQALALNKAFAKDSLTQQLKQSSDQVKNLVKSFNDLKDEADDYQRKLKTANEFGDGSTKLTIKLLNSRRKVNEVLLDGIKAFDFQNKSLEQQRAIQREIVGIIKEQEPAYKRTFGIFRSISQEALAFFDRLIENTSNFNNELQTLDIQKSFAGLTNSLSHLSDIFKDLSKTIKDQLQDSLKVLEDFFKFENIKFKIKVETDKRNLKQVINSLNNLQRSELDILKNKQRKEDKLNLNEIANFRRFQSLKLKVFERNFVVRENRLRDFYSRKLEAFKNNTGKEIEITQTFLGELKTLNSDRLSSYQNMLDGLRSRRENLNKELANLELKRVSFAEKADQIRIDASDRIRGVEKNKALKTVLFQKRVAEASSKIKKAIEQKDLAEADRVQTRLIKNLNNYEKFAKKTSDFVINTTVSSAAKKIKELNDLIINAKKEAGKKELSGLEGQISNLEASIKNDLVPALKDLETQLTRLVNLKVFGRENIDEIDQANSSLGEYIKRQTLINDRKLKINIDTTDVSVTENKVVAMFNALKKQVDVKSKEITKQLTTNIGSTFAPEINLKVSKASLTKFKDLLKKALDFSKISGIDILEGIDLKNLDSGLENIKVLNSLYQKLVKNVEKAQKKINSLKNDIKVSKPTGLIKIDEKELSRLKTLKDALGTVQDKLNTLKDQNLTNEQASDDLKKIINNLKVYRNLILKLTKGKVDIFEGFDQTKLKDNKGTVEDINTLYVNILNAQIRTNQASAEQVKILDRIGIAQKRLTPDAQNAKKVITTSSGAAKTISEVKGKLFKLNEESLKLTKSSKLLNDYNDGIRKLKAAPDVLKNLDADEAQRKLEELFNLSKDLEKLAEKINNDPRLKGLIKTDDLQVASKFAQEFEDIKNNVKDSDNILKRLKGSFGNGSFINLDNVNTSINKVIESLNVDMVKAVSNITREYATLKQLIDDSTEALKATGNPDLLTTINDINASFSKVTEKLRSTLDALKQAKDSGTIDVRLPDLARSTSNLNNSNIVLNTSVLKLNKTIASTKSSSFFGIGAKTGGLIKAFNSGGFAGKVPGTGFGDKMPALLEPGEFVIKRDSVGKFGVEFFKSLNNGDIPGLSTGGIVSPSSMFNSFTPLNSTTMPSNSSSGGEEVTINLKVGDQNFRMKSPRGQVTGLVEAMKSLERGL